MDFSLLPPTIAPYLPNQMSILLNKLPLPPLRPPKTTPDEGIGDEFEVEVAVVDDDIEALLSSINS